MPRQAEPSRGPQRRRTRLTGRGQMPRRTLLIPLPLPFLFRRGTLDAPLPRGQIGGGLMALLTQPAAFLGRGEQDRGV